MWNWIFFDTFCVYPVVISRWKWCLQHAIIVNNYNGWFFYSDLIRELADNTNGEAGVYTTLGVYSSPVILLPLFFTQCVIKVKFTVCQFFLESIQKCLIYRITYLKCHYHDSIFHKFYGPFVTITPVSIKILFLR